MILQITALHELLVVGKRVMVIAENTYKTPVAKITETESFCLVFISRRQIVIVGNSRIRTSEAMLIAALTTNDLLMSMQ